MFRKLPIILLTFLLLFTSIKSAAQFVTIPDVHFVSWLNANGFSGCMNGNQMDTTCNAIVNATSLNCYSASISNLSGISHFDHLDTLICQGNQLTSLPALPNTITYLDCQGNQLSSLPTLPPAIKSIFCASNLLTTLPALPSTLTLLLCQSNQLNSLPTLPSSLSTLFCYTNQLTSRPVNVDGSAGRLVN